MTVGDELGRHPGRAAHLLEAADLVVTSGGLGPTHDDRTVEAIAARPGSSWCSTRTCSAGSTAGLTTWPSATGSIAAGLTPATASRRTSLRAPRCWASPAPRRGWCCDVGAARSRRAPRRSVRAAPAVGAGARASARWPGCSPAREPRRQLADPHLRDRRVARGRPLRRGRAAIPPAWRRASARAVSRSRSTSGPSQGAEAAGAAVRRRACAAGWASTCSPPMSGPVAEIVARSPARPRLEARHGRVVHGRAWSPPS